MAGDDLLDIGKRLRKLQSEDPWLQTAAKTFAKGAPSSAALSFALWQRVHRMSLAEVFRLEYWASLGCCAHQDFAEGIRAVLVDKDRNPKWNPATLEEITPAFIEDHLRRAARWRPSWCRSAERAARIHARTETHMKIAFIGLGNMGGPMALNLHKAGHQCAPSTSRPRPAGSSRPKAFPSPNPLPRRWPAPRW